MNQTLMRDVAIFMAVIESGSFVKAAEKLKVSKPSVSRHVSALEAALQIQLIKRTTRKLSLTEAGHILYQRCQSFDRNLSAAIQDIADLSQHPSGEIKVGFSSYLANDYRFCECVAEFMALYPEIKIELHSFTASHDIDLVKKDLHVYFTDNDMTETRLISKRLKQFKLKLCASPAYLQHHGVPYQLGDLEKHNCLLHYLYEKPKDVWRFIKNNKTVAISVQGKAVASRTHLLLKLARAGVGIALLPEFMIKRHIKAGDLMTLLDDHETEPAEVYTTIYRQKHVPKKLQYFINYVNKYYDILC